MKKMFVAFVALLVSTVAFSLPTPPDDNDPMAEALKQYAAQVDELNQKFDQMVLPPLKGMLQIAKEFGNSTQDELSPEQEQDWNQHQTALMQAFTDIVAPMVEQMFSAAGQPAREITKQELTDMLIGMTALGALGHFQEAKKLTEEEVELAKLLFFPSEEDIQY